MYHSILPLLLLISTLSHAQQTTTIDTNIRTIDLDGYMVRGSGDKIKIRSVKPQHVHMELAPIGDKYKSGQDSTFFLTKFASLEDSDITLQSVELKLKPIDTSLLLIKLALFQITGSDTTLQVFNLKDLQSLHKNTLTLNLNETQNTIHPTDFYLGYGIYPKNTTTTYKYRLISTSKGGEGLLLRRINKQYFLTTNSHFPYIFPFKLTYRKM